MDGPTAAHKTLPFNTGVRVLNLDNGRTTHVRINDRGPFIQGRVIDLSRRAAREIHMIGPGTARVRLYIMEGDGPAPLIRPGQGYTVQVGAFRKQGNARALREKLARRYRDVRVSQTDGRQGILYRVRVGAFASRTDAQELVERLLREGSVAQAVVVGF